MPHHWAVSLGGAEYQAQCLTQELLRSGKYRISMAVRVAPSSPQSDGIAVFGIGESPDRPRIGYLMDALPLYKTLKHIRPNVIYQRVGCGYTAIAAYYAQRNRIPMVWHASSDTDVSRALLTGSTNLVARKLEKRSIEFGLRSASQIICQTKEQAGMLERHYGRRADAIVPNFHPYPLEALDKSGPLTVLWIANLKRLKQPEVFVRLAEQLQALRQVRFVIIGALGSGSRRDHAWRKSLLQGLKATRNLEYVGPQSQEQVNSWLARSHLLVSTSLQEGFPNTFIQAWMREVPVVSLHINPDSVLTREAIGLCTTTEQELVDAVRGLLLNPWRLQRYGQSARRYALQQHSLRNVSLVEQMIETCLANAWPCRTRRPKE